MIKSRRSANADLLQGLYDTVYRSSIQASLLETQGHDMSALMSWRNVLDIIDENRPVLNSTPHKTAVERSLFTSILDLDSQCRKHIAFLQDRAPYIQQSPPQPLPSQFGNQQQSAEPYNSNISHNSYPYSSSTTNVNRPPPPRGTPIRRPQPGASSESSTSIPKLNSSQPLLSPPLQPPADIRTTSPIISTQKQEHPTIDPPRSTSPSKPFLIHTLRSGNGKQSSAKQHGAFLPPTSEPVASSAAAKAWSSGNSTTNLLSTSETSRPKTPRASSDAVRNGSNNSIPKYSHSSAGHRSSPPPPTPQETKPEGLLIDLGEQDRNKTPKAGTSPNGTDTPRRKHKSMLLEGDGTPSNPILLDTTPDKEEKQLKKSSKEGKHVKEKDRPKDKPKEKEKKNKKKKGLTSSKLFPSLHSLRHATNSLTKNFASVGMTSPDSKQESHQLEGEKSSQLSTPKPRTSSILSPRESIQSPPTPVTFKEPPQAIPEKSKSPIPQVTVAAAAPAAPPLYTPPPPPPPPVSDDKVKVVESNPTEDGEGFHSAESASGSSVSFDSFASKKENNSESISTNELSSTPSAAQPVEASTRAIAVPPVPSLGPPPPVPQAASSSSKLTTAFVTPQQGMSTQSTPRSSSPPIGTTKSKEDQTSTTTSQSTVNPPTPAAPASAPTVSHAPTESKKMKPPKHKYSKKQASASIKAHPGSRAANTSSSTSLEKTTYHVVRLHPTQKPSANSIPQVKKVTSATAATAAIASVEKSNHATPSSAPKTGVTKPRTVQAATNGTGPKAKKTAVTSSNPAPNGAPAENEPATAPVMVGADGQVPSKAKVSEPEPEAGTWEAKVKTVLEELKGTIDENISQQILNDIVIKGDEVRWGDIAGLEVAKNSLKETVVYPFLRPDLFSGLREPARGMLLFGPPGTGKTMLARAVATESNSTFFSISASSLTSKYLGESEKLVRTLFTLAKAFAPSIIFVDEIDSLLSTRNEGGEHEASRRIKNEFLVKWSDLQHAAAGREHEGDIQRVLVLAATNLPWAIDEAARRRFVRRQYIPLPERETRQKQLTNLLNHQKCEIADGEMEELLDLTSGFSGSDITALAKDAAMGPLRSLGEALLSTPREKVRAIGFQDFLVSLKYIKPSVSVEGLQAYEEWATKFGSSGA